MDIKEADKKIDVGDAHWYYHSKGMMLLKCINSVPIPAEFADVGAGSAIFTKMLLKHTKASHGVCIDPEYTDEQTHQYLNKTIRFQATPPEELPSLILMMDVLEHIEDDFSFLQKYVQLAQTESYFFITVPAFQSLFSSHDVFLGHYRRYTTKSIEDLINRANLSPIVTCYFFNTLFPAMSLFRLVKRYVYRGDPKSEMSNPNFLVNSMLRFIHKFDLLLFPRFKHFGLSVVCLAKKSN